MTPGRSGREAHVSENPWAARGTHRGKAGSRMWQRPHGGARRNHAGSHRHRHGVDMVADPVLIDTARHYAELDALDALERYTEAHGEPSWRRANITRTSAPGARYESGANNKKEGGVSRNPFVNQVFGFTRGERQHNPAPNN